MPVSDPDGPSQSSSKAHNVVKQKNPPRKTTKGKTTPGKSVLRKKPQSKKKLDKKNKQALQAEWKNVDNAYNNPNSDATFLEYTGLKRPANEAETPLECFLLFFTPQLIEQVVIETNRYYQQEQLKKPSPMPWKDTNVNEMKAFFGVVLAMGLIKLPELEDYWREDTMYSMSWFQSIFTRTRFKQILRYLHLSNNAKEVPRTDANYDKLFKLGGLPIMFSNIFGSMYAPQRELSIDEQMIGTKSRISFIQYMPKKPKKFGIKIWVLCEAATGYCLQFQIYTGKSEGAVEHGLSYRVVFDLMKNYLNKSFRVYFDNFYTSFKLVNDLENKQTYSCGTMRKGRAQLPLSFETEKLNIGEASYLKRNNVIAVHWKDKRDVLCLSSFHNPGETVITRHQNDITKPNLICDYNVYMGGVDKCDQFLSYYSVSRKSLKWWKKVFF